MASKQVTDRQKSSTAVDNAIQHQGEVLQAALSEKAKERSGLALDVLPLLDHLRASLTVATTTMVDADEAHEHELADDPAARATRDEVAREVYDTVVTTRALLVGAYGDASTDALGFFGPTSRDPVVLARQGRSVVKRLTSGSLPTPRTAFMTLDHSSLAATLDDKVTRLEAALEGVAREGREAQLTLTEKHRAISDYDGVFVAVAGTLSGLFALAGLPELAARVRPSRRAPGRTAEDAGESDDVTSAE